MAGATGPIHGSDPFPYVAVHRDFSLLDKSYTLLLVVPYPQGDDGREAELAAQQALITIGTLFSTVERPCACTPVSSMDLYSSVAAFLQKNLSSDIAVIRPLYDPSSVMAEYRLFSFLFGLLLPELMLCGDLVLSLLRDDPFRLTLCLAAKSIVCPPFVTELCRALAANGGFSFDITETKILFSFPRCAPVAHTLYADSGVGEAALAMRAALLLRGYAF